MKVIKDIFSYECEAASSVTIGKFDGIHLGHQELIREAVEYAREEIRAGRPTETVVFTFDHAPATLLTKKERRKCLEEMGVDVIIECPFEPRIITMEAECFVEEILVDRLHACCVTVGEDFRFGYGRKGSGELLREAGATYGFKTVIVGEILDSEQPVSSTRIREALSQGMMEDVNRMLGYTFYVNGLVVHGRQIGRTIGVPTANIIPGKHKLLPPNGVYFTEADINGKTWQGITNIGTKPTVDGHYLGVETFFLDMSEDLYDSHLSLRLLHFSRPERKFDSLQELKARISKDEEEGRAFFDVYRKHS